MEKNKIITISGQPVTGKGTTVKRIIEKLREQGYSKENIHVITTGHEFRNYFNSIFDFIKDYREPEQIESLSENNYLKSLLEKQEYRQILIDTIINLRQSQIDASILTIEDANNLKEFSSLRKVIDKVIDNGIAEKGKEINSIPRPNEIWIIDSRLAFHNIPESFAVRLVSDPKVAAERLFNDKSRGKEDNKYNSVEEAYEAREKRRVGEQSRYLRRYGVDLEDENNYDLIIDTSYSTIGDISDTILTCLECYITNKPFSKKWASPKVFLPLQSERDTIGQGSWYTLEEMKEVIKEDGYIPSSALEAIEVDGIKYIIEGHHRNFASAHLKRTLVPYEIIANDNEEIPDCKQTARQRANSVRLNDLYSHEWLIDEEFSYNEIYPGIYDRLKERDEVQGR